MYARRWPTKLGLVAMVVLAASVLAFSVTAAAAELADHDRPAPVASAPTAPHSAAHTAALRSGGGPVRLVHARRPPTTAALRAAVGPLPPGWVVASHSVTVGGLDRTYLTVEPAALTSPVPVVVLMHGLLMNPYGILRSTGLADRLGPAVLVVPAGWDHSWDVGGCCGPAYRHHVDDLSFVRAAISDVLASTPAADARHVYAVGFSNGGRMAYRLACDMPGALAGFAAVEAVPVDGCPALHPLDITIVAQQSDPLLTVAAGRPPKHVDGHVEPTVTATITRWRALDHCSARPAVTSYGQAVTRTWACADGTELRYVLYPGGAHSWREPTAATPGASDFVAHMIDPSGSLYSPKALLGGTTLIPKSSGYSGSGTFSGPAPDAHGPAGPVLGPPPAQHPATPGED